MSLTEEDIKRIAKEVFEEELKKGIKVGENSITIDGDKITFSDSTTLSTSNYYKFRRIMGTHDSDYSCPFSWDSGTISTTYDMYKIVFRVGMQGNSGAVRMQINGITSNVYDYQYLLDDGIGENTSQPSILVSELDAYENLAGEIIVKGKQTEEANTFYPTVFFNLAASPSDEVAIKGEVKSDVSAVNRFKIWTTQNATGNIIVYGFNF